MATNEKGYLVQLKSPEGENVYPVIPPEAIVKSDGSTYDFDSLFTSVSNGKALVASAITDKGVKTAADATYQQMAENVSSIPVGIPGISKVRRVAATDIQKGDFVKFDSLISASALAAESNFYGANSIPLDDNHYVLFFQYTSSKGRYEITLKTINDDHTIKSQDPIRIASADASSVGVFWMSDTKEFVTVVFGYNNSGASCDFYKIIDDKLVETNSVDISNSSSQSGYHAFGYGYDSDNVYIIRSETRTTSATKIIIDKASHQKKSETNITLPASTGTTSTNEMPPIGAIRTSSGFYSIDSLEYLPFSTSNAWSFSPDGTIYNESNGVGTVFVATGLGYEKHIVNKPKDFNCMAYTSRGVVVYPPNTRNTSSKSSEAYPIYFVDFSTNRMIYMGLTGDPLGSTKAPCLTVGNHIIFSGNVQVSTTTSYYDGMMYSFESGTMLPDGTVSVVSPSFDSPLSPAYTHAKGYEYGPVTAVALSSAKVGESVDVIPIVPILTLR